MSRETKYTAIILKKQPFNEGDEIITFFTKEAGKVRALAKSVKSAKSKLQQKLQALFLVELVVSQSQFPKIIGVEALRVFAGLRENLKAVKMAFYAVELVLKFTADEQKNETLFNLLCDFFEFLDSQEEAIFTLGLVKFKLGILEASGFQISLPKTAQSGNKVFFSRFKGGFTEEKSQDSLQIGALSYETFLKIRAASFAGLPGLLPPAADNNIEELQRLISGFIEHHIERKVKSEKYL